MIQQVLDLQIILRFQASRCIRVLKGNFSASPKLFHLKKKCEAETKTLLTLKRLHEINRDITTWRTAQITETARPVKEAAV